MRQSQRSADSLLSSSLQVPSRTDGRTDARTECLCFAFPLSRMSAASAPTAKMHRPGGGLTLLLLSALWIFCDVNCVRGALPTTGKCILFMSYVCACASLVAKGIGGSSRQNSVGTACRSFPERLAWGRLPLGGEGSALVRVNCALQVE